VSKSKSHVRAYDSQSVISNASDGSKDGDTEGIIDRGPLGNKLGRLDFTLDGDKDGPVVNLAVGVSVVDELGSNDELMDG